MDGEKEMKEMKENHENICMQVDNLIRYSKEKTKNKTYYPPVKETEKFLNQYKAKYTI